MGLVRGPDPRVIWRLDGDHGKIVASRRPSIGESSGEIGRWGEHVARNYLIKAGIFTVKHATFRLVGYRLICDQYDPSTKTVYEVKTRKKGTEPDFAPRLNLCHKLPVEKLANRVVLSGCGVAGSQVCPTRSGGKFTRQALRCCSYQRESGGFSNGVLAVVLSGRRFK